MPYEDRPTTEDVSGQVDAPEDDPEKQRDIRIPDELAEWVICTIHDFEERACRDVRSRGAESCRQYNSNQWEPGVKEAMRSAKRPCLTFNQIRPKIDAVIGEERRNREDWIAKPREGSDENEAEIRTALLKYVRDINELQIDESRAFEDVVITGFGGLSAHLVPSPDGEAPLIRLQYRPWRELRWDPNSRSRDYTDAQWMALVVMGSVHRLRELFPKFEKEISLEFQSLRDDPELPDVETGERPGVTRYIDGEMRPALFEGKEQRIRAVEFYWRAIRVKRIAHLRTQQGVITRDVTDADPLLEAQLQALTSQGLAAIQERTEPAIRACLVVGRKVLAKWWSPFKGTNAFGDPLFPVFIAMASDTDGHVMGLVEPMIDAQSEVNKRWSMVVENYLRQARSGGVYSDAAFENEEEVKKRWGDPNFWAKTKRGAIANQEFKEHTPKPTDQALIGLFQMAEATMDRVSNIEKARLGLTSQETSGVAIRTRALQSALVQVKAFDNFRHMQLLLGKFLNANLGIMFPVKRTLRLTMPAGNTQEVTLNNPAQNQDGAWKIENSTAGNQFDITMDLTPANATYREMQAQNIATLLGQIGPAMKEVPAFFPAFMRLVAGLIRMIDGLPDREKIIGELEEGIQRFLQPKPPPTPAPPKIAVSLRGDLSPEVAADLADGSLDNPAIPAAPKPPPGGAIGEGTGGPPTGAIPATARPPINPAILARVATTHGLPFNPVALSAGPRPGAPVTVETAMQPPAQGV